MVASGQSQLVRLGVVRALGGETAAEPVPRRCETAVCRNMGFGGVAGGHGRSYGGLGTHGVCNCHIRLSIWFRRPTTYIMTTNIGVLARHTGATHSDQAHNREKARAYAPSRANAVHTRPPDMCELGRTRDASSELAGTPAPSSPGHAPATRTTHAASPRRRHRRPTAPSAGDRGGYPRRWQLTRRLPKERGQS